MARHALTGQLAAIKIVQKKDAQLSQAGSLAALDQMDAVLKNPADGGKRMPYGVEREVAIMKLIDHPHIMKLYDIWENRTEM
jgi:serine/threonine protein kinase